MTKHVPHQMEMDFVFDTEFVTGPGLRALGVFIADLAHYVAWETGRAYTGHTVTVELSACKLILKANKGSVPQVMFINAESVLELYRALWLCLHKGTGVWYPDKYAKARTAD
jgi:hypothetical protein